MDSRLDRLKNLNVKKARITDGVKKSLLTDEFQFPLVIEPINSGLILDNWILENQDRFNGYLLKYGAVLFRGFKINNVEKFQHLTKSFPQKLLSYNLRSSPRHALLDNVYVSTIYPNDQTIAMHSENSYAPEPPKKIVFCCITPALVGGETPIADNRQVLNHLNDKLVKKFAEKGVLYKRNLNGILGLPWHEVFQTSDKRVVEEECKKNGISFNWEADDALILRWRKRAIWKHPDTQELIWFNHGLFFNKQMLDERVLTSVDSEDELPNNTFFGDGSEISKNEIEEIKAAYEKSTTKYSWEKGDVLFLDNMLMSHGRKPYQGPRKIVVSMY